MNWIVPTLQAVQPDATTRLADLSPAPHSYEAHADRIAQLKAEVVRLKKIAEPYQQAVSRAEDALWRAQDERDQWIKTDDERREGRK